MNLSSKVGNFLAAISAVIAALTLVSGVPFKTASSNAETWMPWLWESVLVTFRWVVFAAAIAFLTWWVSKRRAVAKAVPSLDAYAYMNPPDRKTCYLKWAAPDALADVSLLLDIRPAGQSVSRKRIATNLSVNRGESMKTELFSFRGGAWRWNTADNDLMHDEPMTCCFVVVSQGKVRASWRFAIPGRHFSESPQVVGESLFNAPLS